MSFNNWSSVWGSLSTLVNAKKPFTPESTYLIQPLCLAWNGLRWDDTGLEPSNPSPFLSLGSPFPPWCWENSSAHFSGTPDVYWQKTEEPFTENDFCFYVYMSQRGGNANSWLEVREKGTYRETKSQTVSRLIHCASGGSLCCHISGSSAHRRGPYYHLFNISDRWFYSQSAQIPQHSWYVATWFHSRKLDRQHPGRRDNGGSIYPHL